MPKQKKIPTQEIYDKVQRLGGIRAAGRELGIPESTIRNRLKKFQPDLPENAYIPEDHELSKTHIGEGGVETVDLVGQGTRFILTSAQNNCDVNEQFLQNLEAFASHIDAKILVSYTVYDRQGYRGLVRKGDAGIKQRDIWWDRRVRPHAINKRVRLHKRLVFNGELDILATTKDPLSSLDEYCGRSSLIVPHNKFAFRCVESREGQMPKEMWTTGSVTKPKFIQRKAGQIAQFHHVTGALLVELREDGYWHVFNLNADESGAFYHLDKFVSKGKVKTGKFIDGLILGDIHEEKMSDKDTVIRIIKALKPKNVVTHDLSDFESRNHHNRSNAFFKIEQGSRRVIDELEDAATFLERVDSSFKGQTYVVASNHHEAFERWLIDTDWKLDPINAPFYLKAALARTRAAVERSNIDMYQWAIQEHLQSNRDVHFLAVDESLDINGIECGIHGHIGPSGTRGNPKAYSRLGFRSFTAHTHTPSIHGGCYTVGVSGDLRMKYNRGPSKWMKAHGIIYPNGKRAFLFDKAGRWQA